MPDFISTNNGPGLPQRFVDNGDGTFRPRWALTGATATWVVRTDPHTGLQQRWYLLADGTYAPEVATS